MASPTAAPPAGPSPPDERTTASGRGAVVGWVLYDFANTIFSISILSYFFPLWIGDELGGGADLYNYVVAASMLSVALVAPFLGAVADLRQRRKPYLIAFTLLAVGATAGFELTSTVLTAALLFVVANIGFQSALLFYNALLPVVAGPGRAGRISGYGTAAGYVGGGLAFVALTLFVAEPDTMRRLLGPLGGFIETEGAVNANAFLPTALLYLVFSLPIFLLVRDRAIRRPQPVAPVETYRRVLRTLRGLRHEPGLGVFMLATFLYIDAANTMITNMALFGREAFELSANQTRNLLLFSTAFAVLGSVGFGFAADRVGPRRALIGVLVAWITGIALAVAASEVWMLLLAGPVVGIALGGTWVVSRVMLVALAPPEKLGELFGFYSVAGKLAAVVGPLLVALVLTGFDFLGSETAYRLAIGSLALVVGVALFLMRFVPDARPDPTVARFA